MSNQWKRNPKQLPVDLKQPVFIRYKGGFIPKFPIIAGGLVWKDPDITHYRVADKTPSQAL